MEETEEKKKKTTSGFTEDISKEMSNSNPLPVEDAFSNLHQCYVSISGYIAPEQMLPAAKAEPRADIYSLGMVLGDMAKATGDKALSKMAEICSCRDPQSRPQNIAQLRQRLSCTPRYRHALLLLCALIIALLAALAGSYYHLEKSAQEPASSASDSIQPNDNKVIDYQLWDK